MPDSEKRAAAEKKLCTIELLRAFVRSHIAGSPTDPSVHWVSLKPYRLAELFEAEHKLKVSNRSVKKVLKELGLRYRKRTKQLATGTYVDRDKQFLIIRASLVPLLLKGPVLSIDCKKKERIGNLYRDGKCYCSKAPKVYDHNYDHLSEGKVVPHGIYDIKLNKGYISIGKSGETAEFVLDNLCWWWEEHGVQQYPGAKEITLLCDAGGANSYRHHVFKYELLKFAKETGLDVNVFHYPPYCSKWNPIEHRFFSHVHRAMSGEVFLDYETVKTLMEQTSTEKGLKAVVRIVEKEYEKGRKIDKSLIEENRILYPKEIKELNYKIVA